MKTQNTNSLHRQCGAACLAACLLLASTAAAQIDPFAPPAGPAGGGAPDPFAPGGGAAPDPSDPFAPTAPAAPAAGTPAPGATASAAGEDDPTAQRVLDTNPQTVDELLVAARNLTNLGRPQLVKDLVKRLLSQDLDQAQLEDINRRYGEGLFLKWTLDSEYAPEAKTFADRVLEAARAAAASAARINALLDDLVGDDAGRRRTAMIELRTTGEPVIGPLLSRLGDSSRAAQHPRLAAAAALLGEFVEPPLVAALQSDKQTLQVLAADILAHRSAEAALPWLLSTALRAGSGPPLRDAAEEGLQVMLGGVPPQDEAARFLERRARAYRTGAAVGSGDPQGLVDFWTWDDRDNAVRRLRMDAGEAAVLHEARVAEALYAISPDSGPRLQLRIKSGLAAAKVLAGIDSPLPDGELKELCRRAGPQALSAALAAARREDRPLAALAAAELLGELGDLSVVQSVGRPSPLCAALNSGHARIRFAALKSIIRLDPRSPYWGADLAMRRMVHFAGTAGAPRAVVAHPQLRVAQSWAGMLREAGYETDVVTRSDQSWRQAVGSIDYELILLSDRLHSPGLRETIQRLREQPLSRRLPIGILAAGDELFGTQNLAREFPGTESFPEPHAAARMIGIVRRLEGTREMPPLNADLRSSYGQQSLQWLAGIADEPQKYDFYELGQAEEAAARALLNPAVSGSAASVLAKLATPQAQQALVDLASANTLPLKMRQAAAGAFAEAVKRRGLLLVEAEMLRQYARYNQSRLLPRETQQVLGSILDVIEASLPRSPLAGPG